MNTPFTSLRLEPLLQRAEARKQEKHNEFEKTKVGSLRGGNSGIAVGGEDGGVYGTCHRLSLARYRGISKPNGDSSVHFFEAGHANEESWHGLFEELRDDLTGIMLREGEVPTKWSVPGPDPEGPEVEVTGSPDFVNVMPHDDYVAPTYDEAGRVLTPARNFTPLVVFELKKVCSTYRACKTFVEVLPDSKHLIQLAHYSWQHGKVPGILSYRSDSNYDTPYWAIKKFKAERKIPPGRQHFYTGWDGDMFCFINPVTAEVIETSITPDAIRDYYRLVVALDAQKTLGPRPSRAEVYGNGKSYDECTTCPFAQACDIYDGDSDYESWIDRIQSVSDTDSEEDT
jgi:hypothetical protein